MEKNWFKKAIIYHILIDRFARYKKPELWDKPEFIGGNIKGIIEKIPYLKNLGINTIWISPFYKTSQYHGYHITDFMNVDPHFGTTADLERLIELVHQNNMYIIADFVPNHCSKNHPFFIDAQQNKNSEYKNWFYFKKHPNDYLCFLSVKDLPKINLNHPPAKKHITDAAKHWQNLGLDGYRLDHVIGPSFKFWREFVKEIKKPGFILIGEAWMMGIKFHELKTINIQNKYLNYLFGSSSDKLLKQYKNILDGVLDFRLQEMLRDKIAWDKKLDINKEIKKHYKKYPKNYYLPTFLDNHDVDRFLFNCKNQKEKLKKAAETQFLLDQPPIIYYGTESGMTQEKSMWEIPSHGDLQARKPMNWDDIDRDLFSFYQTLIKQRKNQ